MSNLEQMIVAIYARKSTEQNVVDEQKSVARQIAHAREYAARKGWTVNEASVFLDDGISGAEFARRPGFVRLMASLTPRPAYQVLIMSEESRLGREMAEVIYALKQIVMAGVRVFFYLEDRERTLDSPIEKAMLMLQTMADEVERDKARQRAHDKARALARAGYVSGGKCFGYDNVPVPGANGERSHTEQRINDKEAAVIRRIFELAAAGVGQMQIAKQLNAEGAQAPRSQQGRPRAWGPSSVHEALFRPRYRGEIVWNRTRKRDRWGQHRASDRSEDQWLRVPAPHLRIVPEELWQAAHARITAARNSGNIRIGPVVSKHLLPGLARCAWCNGGLYARKRTRTRRQAEWFYACTSHHQRGHAVCHNVVQVPVPEADRAVLGSIGDILTPDLVDDIILRLREFIAPERRDAARKQLAQQIAAVDQQAGHLVDAIAEGGEIPPLVTRLKRVQQQRQELLRALAEYGEAHALPQIDWRSIERQARRVMADWRELLGRHTLEARQLLRELLEGPLRFTPILEGTRRGYRFEGAIKIGELLSGNVDAIGLASPGRIELPA
jgi:site-specific DNA recombinase